MLVVEDDYFVSIDIETILNEVGITASAEEAIELAARERPDLILMDVRLAGSLDGIDAATDIHSRLGIRSLFVTAHSDPDTRQRGERANPVGWVLKPFSSHELKASMLFVPRSDAKDRAATRRSPTSRHTPRSVSSRNGWCAAPRELSPGDSAPAGPGDVRPPSY